jgi:NAD-dependent deacetylase sirtuin 2
VFFGEDLPERFHRLVEPDFSECDLLLVMGTSLAVNPFASLVAHVPSQV